MGLSLFTQNVRELWKEWGLRLLILLSLFLQLTLASLGSKRKYKSSGWIQLVMTYLLADSIAVLTLGLLSSRLADIKEMKGTFDPKSQITAFWASFLLLHLGGPDAITAFALADNELYMRQLGRFCIKVGVACYIYFMTLSGSTLSIVAKGMMLVGIIKYAERTLCMYLASGGRLRDSLRPFPNIGAVYFRKIEQYLVKKEEGYRVETDEVIESKDFSIDSGQVYDNEKATALVKAYELFKTFKLLFVGLWLNSDDLQASRRLLLDAHSGHAFRIVEMELGFMYDLLYTKVPLLNCAWAIIRWVINLLVPCAVLVLLSLQDKKDYPKVDVCITFLLICVTILLEVCALLQAISSDWVKHWQLQRPERSTILSVVDFLPLSPNHRWRNSVAQLSLLSLFKRKTDKILLNYPSLAKHYDEVKKNFYVSHKEFKQNIKNWISSQLMREPTSFTSLKEEASQTLKQSNRSGLLWSVEEVEFDQSLLIWHIATEICYYEDRDRMRREDPEYVINEDPEYVINYKMSKLVSRYMFYLLVNFFAKLPTVIGEIRYQDTLVDARKFFYDKKEAFDFSFCGCNKNNEHKSIKSRHVCKVCRLLRQTRTDLPPHKFRGDKSTSVLVDGCLLASQLKHDDGKWLLINKVWAAMLVYSVRQTKGYEHCQSLSTGGELLGHIWLLMAHLGLVPTTQQSGGVRITKLIAK